jgi:chorismate synthase
VNSNSTGKALVFTSFGESHGVCIGAVLDGVPAGLSLNLDYIQGEIDKRRPGFSNIATSRKEKDHVKVLSGIFKGYTTGAPICMLIKNFDVNSEPYEKTRYKPRPGHADYVSHMKYGGYHDYRGSGRFSGRITASYVMVGAIAKRLLKLIDSEILAHTIQIGNIKNSKPTKINDIRKNVYKNPARCASPKIAHLMEQEILKVANEGDSLGGTVEAIALNIPLGLGEPIFDSLDSDLAKMLFNIPGVKAVEFGAGSKVASMKGFENNDQYAIKKGKIITLTNNAGGILGGISNGMPILIKVHFKPTSSISKKQKTVDLNKMEETSIELVGRHDPCIVPRAVPVVESCIAFVLADHLMRQGKIPKIVNKKN